MLIGLASRVEALEARDAARRLSRVDRDRLRAILPAITGAFGSSTFLVREALASDAPGLRLVLADVAARSLGRLLRRATGVPVDGYVVERVTVEDGAVLWRVEAVAEFSP